MPARHQMLGFNLIWVHFEWMEYCVCKNTVFGKSVAPSFFKIPQKNSRTPNRLNQPLSVSFAINEKLDLKKLVWKLSISGQLPELFDLLCPKPFENITFDLNPKGEKSQMSRRRRWRRWRRRWQTEGFWQIQIQSPPNAARDEIPCCWFEAGNFNFTMWC